MYFTRIEKWESQPPKRNKKKVAMKIAHHDAIQFPCKACAVAFDEQFSYQYISLERVEFEITFIKLNIFVCTEKSKNLLIHNFWQHNKKIKLTSFYRNVLFGNNFSNLY